MENLLLGNQVILLNDNIDFEQLKNKVSQMCNVIMKFTVAIESAYPEFSEMLNDNREKIKSWELSMKKTDAPKSLLMSEMVQFIDHVKKEIESQKIKFDKRKDEEYIDQLFCVDTTNEYEPMYLLRPIAVDFIGLWTNPRTSIESKLQIVSYLYLVQEFGNSIMESFLIMDKDEFKDKYGFDLANFDLDNMNFSINSISDSFAKMLKADDESMDTNPLTETVNTVLTTFLGVDDASQNISLSTLQDLHTKAREGGKSKGVYDKLDEISAKLDEKGISDTDLVNSVKNLSNVFTKNSNIKNPKIKELFKKLAEGDISDPDTLAECQKMMHSNPLFKSMGFDVNQMPKFDPSVFADTAAAAAPAATASKKPAKQQAPKKTPVAKVAKKKVAKKAPKKK